MKIKAGKGRTGTIIACYLLYAGLIKTPNEALEFYASQRSHENKGVTRPSQKRFLIIQIIQNRKFNIFLLYRYIQYFYDVCFNSKVYKSIPKKLKKIEFGPGNWINAAYISPIVSIDQMSSNCTVPDNNQQLPAKVNVDCLFHSEVNDIQFKNEEDLFVLENMDYTLCGDIILRCKYYSRFWQRETYLFRISFHTAFIENNIIVFPKNEIGLANKDNRYVKNFFFFLQSF